MIKKRKKKKKENSTELQKPKIEAEVYNNNKKCDWVYIYTFTPITKIKTGHHKLSTVYWPAEQRKPKILSTRTKLIKAQTQKKTTTTKQKKLKQGANWRIKQWK